MKFEDFSDDSDVEIKTENVKKLITKPILQTTSNNGVGRKIPHNVLIPDANGVVRINQKQLPSLSTGVYIMSKTAGIIKLDSSTSKVATSGGQTIVKVAPKIGQTQIKIVKKDIGNKLTTQAIQKPIVHKPHVTIVNKIEENKPVKQDEESDDGLEELEFPTDLPLPEPESPPSDFVLDPATGKLAGHEYPEKEEETNSTSLENIVKLAAADITEEDLKPEPILDNNTEPTVVVVQTTKPPQQQQQQVQTNTNVITNSMNILQRSLTAAPKLKSTPRILNQSRVTPTSSTTIHVSVYLF